MKLGAPYNGLRPLRLAALQKRAPRMQSGHLVLLLCETKGLPWTPAMRPYESRGPSSGLWPLGPAALQNQGPHDGFQSLGLAALQTQGFLILDLDC